MDFEEILDQAIAMLQTARTHAAAQPMTFC
jgi:hypothetical protein